MGSEQSKMTNDTLSVCCAPIKHTGVLTPGSSGSTASRPRSQPRPKRTGPEPVRPISEADILTRVMLEAPAAIGSLNPVKSNVQNAAPPPSGVQKAPTPPAETLSPGPPGSRI